MSYLINRNPPARFQCLHGLCKFINNNYGTSKSFRMNDIKFNSKTINIHAVCELLVTKKSLGLRYCPYKEKNPLSVSGCGLTNGVLQDTTKSKEVSNTVNALDGLGLISRTKNDLILTDLGKAFAETSYNTAAMHKIIVKAVLNYGMFVGFLAQIKFNFSGKTFNTDELFVGYPTPKEEIIINGRKIVISSGSEKDSNVRTKSCLLAWATTAGFIQPVNLTTKVRVEFAHVDLSDYLLQSNRSLQYYKIIDIPDTLFNNGFITSKPLDYNNLTKNIGALRENNQKESREITMQMEAKIKNRRFAILYSLNQAFSKKVAVNLESLIRFLILYEDEFIVDKTSFQKVMNIELSIAYMAGIPFLLQKDKTLIPLTGLNLSELNLNVPTRILNIVKSFQL